MPLTRISLAFVCAYLVGASSHVLAQGFDWSTGQGIVNTCQALDIPTEDSTKADVSLKMICIVQFKAWRDAWTFSDTYSVKTHQIRGPVCVPEEISNKVLIDGFMDWAKSGVTEQLKPLESTLSAFLYMSEKYPCDKNT